MVCPRPEKPQKARKTRKMKLKPYCLQSNRLNVFKDAFHQPGFLLLTFNMMKVIFSSISMVPIALGLYICLVNLMHVKNPWGENYALKVYVPPFICGMKFFWIKVSFADRLWCSGRQGFESKRRLEKRRYIYIVWETHLEFWWICSLKRIIFSHLNGFLFPSLDIWRMWLWDHSLRMGVHTKGQFVEVCLTKCKVTQSSFFGSTIRMSAFLKNLGKLSKTF